ncbi:MAG: hypothetical protein RLZZ15_2574 [Verrucomicrobiota bacterium]|jgi:predicted MFS family arabinose efflux permease
MSKPASPPEHRRIWRGVAALAVAEMVAWGVLVYAFGVLLPAMEADLGIGRSALTAVFSGALVASGLTAPLIARALDRWGARRVMTTGAAAAVLLLVAWSRAETLAGCVIVWLALGGAHAAVLYDPAFVAATRWCADVRERTRALLAITILGGLASTVFLPLTAALLERHGWRHAVLALAGVFAAVALPLFASLPDGDARPAAGGARAGGASGGSGATRPGFAWLVAAFALQGAIFQAMVVHAVPLLTEAGRTPVRAAALTGMFGFFQVVGRLLSVSRLEKISTRARLTGLLAAQVVAVVALLFARHDAAVWVFVVCFGASNGAITLARPLAVAEWQGGASFAIAAGRVSTWTQLSRAAAPVAAGALHAVAGYGGVLVALAGVGLGGLAAARAAARKSPEVAAGK